ncbi:hypothetical protein P692DRAFT_201695050, partial [Suillus brevipes Sb2]
LLTPVASLNSVSIYPPTFFQDPSGTPIIPNAHNILKSVIKTRSNTPVVASSFLEQCA